MSHSVPPPTARRRPNWQQILGAVLVASGLVFGVFAIVALSKPNGAQEKSGAQMTVTGTGSPPPPVTDSPTSGSSGSSGESPGASTSTSPESSTSPGSSTSSGSGGGGDSSRTSSVVILNNTDITGLAARARADLQAAGWTVTDATNYSNDIISTAAYYDPSDPASAQAAQDLQAQFPWIKRVVPRFAQLPASPIVLILTAGY